MTTGISRICSSSSTLRRLLLGAWSRIKSCGVVGFYLPTVGLNEVAEIIGSLNGRFERVCPICSYVGYFRSAGSPPRWDARCPNCGSLERHRLFYLASRDFSPIPANVELLHFAPETAVRRFLEPCVVKYLTSGLDGNVDLVLNIEEIQMPDGSVDVVVCNHVLEHVDDRKALIEMFRILRLGGKLYLTTPVIEGWGSTYENAIVTSELDRELHYGQRDHVRFFGRDIRDRIRSVGFELVEYTADGEDCVKFGLLRGEKVFIAVKPRVAGWG